MVCVGWLLYVQVTELYIDEWSSSDPKVQAGFELFLTAADHAGIDLLVYVGEDAGPGVAADVASVGKWCANATGRCGPRPTTVKTDDDDGNESAEGTGLSAAEPPPLQLLSSSSGAPVVPPLSPPGPPPPPPPPQAACTAGHATQAMPFCNADLPRDARTWDLIGRLNLTEKVSLLTAGRAWVGRLGVHSLEGNECLHGLFNRGNDVTVDGTLEQYAIDGAATIFPQGIGLAATWNRTLLRAMGDVISTEAVAKRNEHRRNNRTDWPFYLTCWAPVINIARDPRWGRTPETYGEDPLREYFALRLPYSDHRSK